MILYFSATGNSRYVAERIAKETKDDIVSLNLLMKQDKHDALISETKPFVFVCPTYAWRLPRLVEDYIRKTTFKGSRKAYFVLTYGGETASASNHVNKLCQYKDWDLQGYAQVKMPDNYLVMFPGVDKATVKQINKAAEPIINQILEDINNGYSISSRDENGVVSRLKSGFINSIFYRFIINAEGFHIEETKCVSCGKCVELCPLNNIILTDGKPQWGTHCTHCMACLHRCPTEAIEYKKKTQGKPRYSFDNK